MQLTLSAIWYTVNKFGVMLHCATIEIIQPACNDVSFHTTAKIFKKQIGRAIFQFGDDVREILHF